MPTRTELRGERSGVVQTRSWRVAIVVAAVAVIAGIACLLQLVSTQEPLVTREPAETREAMRTRADTMAGRAEGDSTWSGDTRVDDAEAPLPDSHKLPQARGCGETSRGPQVEPVDDSRSVGQTEDSDPAHQQQATEGVRIVLVDGAELPDGLEVEARLYMSSGEGEVLERRPLPVDAAGSVDVSVLEWSRGYDYGWWIAACAPGFVEAALPLDPATLRLDLVLVPGSTINVKVDAPQLESVEGIEVWLYHHGGGPVFMTDADGFGSIVVPPLDPRDVYRIGVSPHQLRLRCEPVALEIIEAGLTLDVVLHVEPIEQGVIRGRIADDLGRPIADTDVVIDRQIGLAGRFEVRTDGDGWFEATMPVEGPTLFHISAPLYEPAVLEAAVGSTVSVTLRRMAWLDISLRDPLSGVTEPLRAVRGAVTHARDTAPEPPVRYELELDDTSFLIPPGDHDLVAFGAHQGVRCFPTAFHVDGIAPGERYAITVDLLPGRVEGTVYDDQGHPLRDPQDVVVVRLSASSHRQERASIQNDESGRFRFKSVPEGQFTLRISGTRFVATRTTLTLDANGISGLQIQLTRAE